MKFHPLSLLAIILFVSLSLAGIITSLEYDPFLDVDESGNIDILGVIELANYFGTSGTSINKTQLLLELLERVEALENQTGWLPAPAYDSGWIDITDKAGQNIIVVHGLGSMDVMVDITGRTTVDGGVHQKQIGGEDYTEAWNRTYGGTSPDYAYSVVQTADGGYAIASDTYSYGAGGGDCWLVKTDSNGNMQTGLFKDGLVWIDSTLDSITLHRGTYDSYWNFVRVRIWKIKTP